MEKRRVFAETISGTVPAMERPVLAELVRKLEEGDTLMVAKLDRPGRSAADVDSTVQMLRATGVRVVGLDLQVQEVASAAGDLILRMFAAFAQFEREQIAERTHAGHVRARAEGRNDSRLRKSEQFARNCWQARQHGD